MAIVSVRQAGLGGFTKNRRLSYTFPSTMGMVLLSPTSIAFSGTSASIGANGQVTFTAVTSLSLNGVFSATYDNYVISIGVDPTGSDNAAILYYRLRAAGSDNSTASSYTFERIFVTGTSVSAARTSSNKGTFAYIEAAANGYQQYLYGPFLAQPTATRSISASDVSGAGIYEYASTHNQSTSYDGITFLWDLAANASTGKLAVYGLRS